MQNRKKVLIKYLALMLILVSALLLSACRTRITNNNEVSNIYYDEDGYLSETYEMRREELSLSTAKKPLLPDFGPIEDDEEDVESGESINYEPEEEEYVEPPEVQNANNSGTSTRTTRRYNYGRSSNSSSRSTERVTITFDPNGGKCNTTEKRVYAGSRIGHLPEATKDGKTTKLWYTSKTGGSAVKSTDTVEEDITLYARWDEEEKKDENEDLTVTFNTHGGTAVESKKVKKGTTIELPTTTRDGYEFKGWSTSEQGSVINSKSYVVEQTITLHAQWNSKSSTPDPKPDPDKPDPDKPDPDKPDPDKPDPDKPDPDKPDPDPPTPTETFTVTLNGMGGGDSSDTVDENGKYTLPLLKKKGFTHVSWTINEDGSGKTYSPKEVITITKDLTLYAQWDRKHDKTYWEVDFEDKIRDTNDIDCYIAGIGDSSWLQDCHLKVYKTTETVQPEIAIVFVDDIENPGSAETDVKELLPDATIYLVSTEAEKNDKLVLAYQIAIANRIHGIGLEEDVAAREIVGEDFVLSIKP